MVALSIPKLLSQMKGLIVIELSRNYARDTDTHSAESDELKLITLQDYLDLAEIRHYDGLANEVVQTLSKLVGDGSLSIDRVALILGLSRRTLQRKLQREGTSFAALRDDVRFHYAIQYLIGDRTRIGTITKALDFTDRMCFTSAFKRWCGLSPSVFRRRFRFGGSENQ